MAGQLELQWRGSGDGDLRKLRARLGGKIGDYRARQTVEHGLLGAFPNRVCWAPGLSRAGPLGNEAEVEEERPVDGLYDLAHGGFATLGQDFKTARVAPAREDEIGTREGLQNLGEKALRGRGCVGNVVEQCPLV